MMMKNNISILSNPKRTLENNSFSSTCHSCSFLDGSGDVTENCIRVFFRDGRPNRCFGVKGVADPHFLSLVNKFGQKLIVDASLDENSGAVGANFALIKKTY